MAQQLRVMPDYDFVVSNGATFNDFIAYIFAYFFGKFLLCKLAAAVRFIGKTDMATVINLQNTVAISSTNSTEPLVFGGIGP